MGKQSNQGISGARVLKLLETIDRAARAGRITTTEMIFAARQMLTSAVAQLIEDNPQASATEIADSVVGGIRSALSARIGNASITNTANA